MIQQNNIKSICMSISNRYSSFNTVLSQLSSYKSFLINNLLSVKKLISIFVIRIKFSIFFIRVKLVKKVLIKTSREIQKTTTLQNTIKIIFQHTLFRIKSSRTVLFLQLLSIKVKQSWMNKKKSYKIKLNQIKLVGK